MNQLFRSSDGPLDRLKKLIAVLEKFRLDIEDALCYSGDRLTFDELCARVLAGEFIVHSLPNAVLLCEVDTFAHKRVYHVYIAAGNLDDILEFQRTSLLKEADERGCQLLGFTGRLGWTVALKEEGWKTLSVTMVKEV